MQQQLLHRPSSVGFVILAVCTSAQDIRGAKQVAFQLLLREFGHGWSCGRRMIAIFPRVDGKKLKMHYEPLAYTVHPMPEPKSKDVYDDPHHYWDLITVSSDEKFEGQHFERKQAGRLDASGEVDRTELKELVLKTVSAFANSNREGGLLVLGIASNGEVKGIDHLSASVSS